MKNKKKTLIIIAVCIATFAGIFAISKIQKNTDNKENEPCENCTVNTVKSNNPFNIVYSGETKTYNAYDFIIEKMSQAQYWTYDEYEPTYRQAVNDGKLGNLSHDHTIPNGSGWTLTDENTASFARGFEGKLEIKFSDNTAASNVGNCSLDTLYLYEHPETLGVPVGGAQVDLSQYDVSKKPWDYFDEITASVPGINKMYEDNFIYINCNDQTYNEISLFTGVRESQQPFGPHYYISDGTEALYWEVESTLNFYGNVFKEAGCPLQNMPEGTLTSYKNKTIEVPVELIELRYTDRWGDGLIHCPWRDQEDFVLDTTTRTDVVWLDEYKDVFDQKKPPESELWTTSIYEYSTGEHLGDKTYSYYSPYFLQIVIYDDNQESREEGITNKFSAIAANYYAPLYRHIFGFDGVYFFDATNKKVPPTSGEMNRDTFVERATEAEDEEIFSLYANGEMEIGVVNYGWKLKEYFDDLLKYYGKENIFGDDYPTLFNIRTNPDMQERLGLK